MAKEPKMPKYRNAPRDTCPLMPLRIPTDARIMGFETDGFFGNLSKTAKNECEDLHLRPVYDNEDDED